MPILQLSLFVSVLRACLSAGLIAQPVEPNLSPLRVTAVDALGQLLPGVVVTVAHDSFEASSNTDHGGVASFRVPDGTYTIRCSLPGFRTSRLSTVLNGSVVAVTCHMAVSERSEVVFLCPKPFFDLPPNTFWLSHDVDRALPGGTEFLRLLQSVPGVSSSHP